MSIKSKLLFTHLLFVMLHRTSVIVCTALLVLSFAPAMAQVLTDDFDDNEIDASLWRAFSRGLGPTVAETNRAQGPLVKTLRASLMNSFRDSAPPGYVPDPYCASGADGGAVGIHFVNFGLVDNVLNAAEPEVLYYEPLPGGRIRLVGAEYVYFQDFIGTPPVTPQHLEGHLLHYMVAPNRFGIPFDWLRLNVWAWKPNPNGTFAGDNPNVSCDAYDPNLHPQP